MTSNIVDVTSLRVTINHLKVQDIGMKHGLLDASYCSEKNINDLYANGIPFMIRLPNNALAKELIREHGADVCRTEYVL